jgi:hypothetical protein
MKLYLSGKITGCRGYKKLFADAKKRLSGKGYTVISPADLKFSKDTPWAVAMKAAVTEMLKCDGVALLENWENSPGAVIEQELAEKLKMRAWPVFDWLCESYFE